MDLRKKSQLVSSPLKSRGPELAAMKGFRLSPEWPDKLARSLNTLFDTLNQIIGVIHTTFLGQKGEMETIRLIIGSALKGEAV